MAVTQVLTRFLLYCLENCGNCSPSTSQSKDSDARDVCETLATSDEHRIGVLQGFGIGWGRSLAYCQCVLGITIYYFLKFYLISPDDRVRERERGDFRIGR